MISIFVFLVSTSLVISLPIETLKTEPNSSTDEVVYVPYAIKYVAVEGPIQTEYEESSSKINMKNIDKLLKLEDNLANDNIKMLPLSTMERKNKEVSKAESDDADSNRQSPTSQDISSIAEFKNKLYSSQAKPTEDYVLIPIAVLNKLEKDSFSKTHIVSKRQAPNRIISRRPALVGYLNDYDLFPTVA